MFIDLILTPPVAERKEIFFVFIQADNTADIRTIPVGDVLCGGRNRKDLSLPTDFGWLAAFLFLGMHCIYCIAPVIWQVFNLIFLTLKIDVSCGDGSYCGKLLIDFFVLHSRSNPDDKSRPCEYPSGLFALVHSCTYYRVGRRQLGAIAISIKTTLTRRHTQVCHKWSRLGWCHLTNRDKTRLAAAAAMKNGLSGFCLFRSNEHHRAV